MLVAFACSITNTRLIDRDERICDCVQLMIISLYLYSIILQNNNKALKHKQANKLNIEKRAFKLSVIDRQFSTRINLKESNQ